MKIDVIIPTYKPDKGFIELLDMLLAQSIIPDRIIVANTESSYWDSFVKKYPDKECLKKTEVFHVEKSEFDHGKTRNEAMKRSDANICIVMTMDAIPANEKLIENLNLKVEPGQKVAIVGPTGAGKSTIINLLMRFYELNDGSIHIDGTDIADVSRENVHDYFSMVLQETWLFEGTLRENLVYNQKCVSDQKLDEVCAACGLTDMVRQLPDGYDTVLGDNVGLSQGQCQLITIARAMLKDAPLLILDEATSSVDTRTELKVQKAMDKLTEGRTSFVIAHRLSTIKNADCIFVMKDGDVIESGTHKELLAKKGFYADLYNSQFDAA